MYVYLSTEFISVMNHIEEAETCQLRDFFKFDYSFLQLVLWKGDICLTILSFGVGVEEPGSSPTKSRKLQTQYISCF